MRFEFGRFLVYPILASEDCHGVWILSCGIIHNTVNYKSRTTFFDTITHELTWIVIGSEKKDYVEKSIPKIRCHFGSVASM